MGEHKEMTKQIAMRKLKRAKMHLYELEMKTPNCFDEAMQNGQIILHHLHCLLHGCSPQQMQPQEHRYYIEMAIAGKQKYKTNGEQR